MDELRAEAIAEFQQERLSSYYTEHPEVAQRAINTLKEAQALFDAGFIPASLVFAVSATEQALKNILLQPILYGVVHSELAAGLVASLDVRLNRLPKLLFPIIADTANVDLLTYCRRDQPKTLWAEFKHLQGIRNGVLHGGEPVEQGDASTALMVGGAMLTDVCERVMAAVAPAEQVR
jgi:hypothetical protein